MDTITKTRIELAQKSLEELKNIPYHELQRLAKQAEIKASGKQETIINRIIEACQGYQKIISNAPITETLEYTGELDEDLQGMANKYYGQFNDCLTDIFVLNKPVSTGLQLLAKNMALEIKGYYLEKTGKSLEESETIGDKGKNYKNAILNHIEEITKTAYTETDLDWKKQFGLLRQLVNAEFQDRVLKIRETTRANIIERKTNPATIDAYDLLEWAQKRLAKLPTNAPKYVEVACALMLVTGRRQSEITCSAKFEYVDSEHVNFTGQLKRHGSYEDENEPETFEIPTLTNAQDVVNGLEWLEQMGKRDTEPDKAHNRFSRYLNAQAKILFAKYVQILEGEMSYTDHKGKKVDRANCHQFRQIYGQIQFIKSDLPSTQKTLYIGEIMGHGGAYSLGNNASASYDTDVVLENAEKLLTLL
jgi:hypothetical protein